MAASREPEYTDRGGHPAALSAERTPRNEHCRRRRWRANAGGKMKSAFLAATFVLVSHYVDSSSLLAQTNSPSAPRSISRCSSGLRGGGPECAPDRRLLIALTMNDSDPPPVMLTIVAVASNASGAFALDRTNATTADSAIYAVLTVQRDLEGNYRFDRSMAGSKLRATDNCRGYSTGRADEMGFGAFLALETQQLVRCVQRARGAPGY
jgi:hypothetical protein